MKITRFRIKNYKSIIDTGDCILDQKITIFAGKNESGKSTILEALSDFDVKKTIDKNKIPITNGDSELKLQIIITFEISKKEFSHCFQNKNWTDELEIIKSFPNTYNFSEKTKNKLKITNNLEETENKLKTINNSQKKEIKKKLVKMLLNFHKKYGDFFMFEENFWSISKFSNFKKIIGGIKKNIAKPDFDASKAMKISFKKIENIFSDWNESKNFKDTSLVKIKQLIPNFVLFSTHKDVFPNKILIQDLENNSWANAFRNISDLDFELIKSKNNDREKEEHKDNINKNIDNDYNNFWTQDLAKLSISFDQDNLFFWIKENNSTYEPSMRSEGKRWHLSFYIKVTSRVLEEQNNVILVDEPGLFLHPEAQRNILEKFEKLSEKTNIIFSTHSPYLLEMDKLERIKLVTKFDKEGTQIENKLHKVCDKETLTPILSAIGLKMNSGIDGINKLKNVIVEGITDVYYLQAFKKIRNKTEEQNINFIMGGGVGNMPIVGTIIHGWGGKVMYLFDSDEGGKNGQKNWNKNWKGGEDLVLTILDNSEFGTIENLFSEEDAQKYDTKTNYKKASKFTKAWNFLKLVERKDKVVLNAETLRKIDKLFKKINQKFEEILVNSQQK